jgi:hypothetical protein
MTDIETKKILAILKAAYPAFYSKMGRDELYGVVNVWQDAFADVSYDMVAIAVKSLIKTHSGYPPDIAAVHSEIKSVVAAAAGEPTDEELWNIYKRAVQESGYCENETFEKLPPILQRYCGSARTLREHAMSPLDTFITVTKGQFLKQIPLIRQRQEYHDSLPEAVRNAISGMVKQKSLPQPEQPPTPQELNEKRNKAIARLAAPLPKSEYKPLSEEETQRRKRALADALDGMKGTGT